MYFITRNKFDREVRFNQLAKCMSVIVRVQTDKKFYYDV